MRDTMRVVSLTLDENTIFRLDKLCTTKSTELGTVISRSAMVRMLVNKSE